MKALVRIMLCVLMISYPLFLTAQSQDQNYISVYHNTSLTTAVVEHQYYDGLGRLIGKTSVNLSPTISMDLVENITYDIYGRVYRKGKKIGLSGNNGKYCEVTQEQYISEYKEPYAFVQYSYKDTPLERKAREAGPGAAWIMQGRMLSFNYETNSTTSHLECLQFEIEGQNIVNKSRFPDGALSVFKTTDEDDRTVYEFKDGQDRLILSRKLLSGTDVDTYYIYDDRGDLRAVLPPEATLRLSAPGAYSCDDNEAIQNYAYLYTYDIRHRCISKKMPGIDKATIKYDDADRPVSTQTARQRENNTYTKLIYDQFGRVKTQSDGNLFITYFYDDYDSIPNITCLNYVAKLGYGSRVANVNTLQTGNVVSTDEGNLLHTVCYYDQKGQLIQKRMDNNLGGYDAYYYAYSYTGKVNKMLHEHILGTKKQEEIYSYEYDNADRLTKVSHQLNGGTIVTLRQNTYDKLGRLERQKVFDKEDVSYTYNIKEWPTAIASTNFKEALSYYDGKNREFGGNISTITWSTENTSLSRKYDFSYDGLSRLTSATYSENGTANGHYDASYTYDLMGNMLTLKRNGLQDGGTYGAIDNVKFSYIGNQLAKADDNVEDPTYKDAWNFVDGASTSIEYVYDKDGNRICDLNKQIPQIVYNSLNLPQVINFYGGKTIRYVYDAMGVKLRASYSTTLPSTNINFDYSGNMIYENGALSQILVDGGYITFANDNPVYHYYLKDHLGNNRIVVNHNTGMVEQVNHYYPYGGLMAESTGGNVQRYKYNGKELDGMHGWDCYDYGSRWYDASIIGWNCIDRLSEKNYRVSQYGYCDSNPIRYFDDKGNEKIDALPQNDRQTNILRTEISSFVDAPDVINIWGHGIEGQNELLLNDKVVSTPSRFEEFLSENSIVWKTREDNEPVTIVLHCCSSTNFSQMLSKDKRFKNVTIIAPNSDIIVGRSKKTKRFITSYLEGKGKWTGFKNGKEIKEMSFGKYDHPGSILPKIHTNLLDVLMNSNKNIMIW